MDTVKSRPEGEMPYPYESPSNNEEVVRTKILNALHWDSAIDLSDITVDVDKDAVVLSGTVKHEYEKTAAEAHVRKLPEVSNVKNDIVVEP